MTAHAAVTGLPSLSRPKAPLTNRFEWHYTPKHSSWLNVTEMELIAQMRHPHRRSISATSL